jgi:AcrR family transcriptional regulator
MPRGEFDRSERRARTRRRLLEAAASVYAERGLEGATLDEVAERAGFTKGAVYDHFGSKENLLAALLDEHLAAEIGEQVELFDATLDSGERPRVGADRWIAHLDEDPDAFRLFVEAWVKGQRDEAVRERIIAGAEAWRAMFRGFGVRRSAELGEPEGALENLPDVMLALGLGFAMLRLADPDRVPPRLLGAVYAVLLGAVEDSPEARALIAGAGDADAREISSAEAPPRS